MILNAEKRYQFIIILISFKIYYKMSARNMLSVSELEKQVQESLLEEKERIAYLLNTQ